ncbi:MAG TPA: hypothetical protein VMP01_09350 [Pirellulaceae bacterium]|nr:hypothetical protein [Pirellulaceae bacterium]
MLEAIAKHLVGNRPDRFEPRVKSAARKNTSSCASRVKTTKGVLHERLTTVQVPFVPVLINLINRALSARGPIVLFYRDGFKSGRARSLTGRKLMSAAQLAFSVAYPDVLGELPVFSVQSAAAVRNRADSAVIRLIDDEFGLQLGPNDHLLWANLGAWDL